MASNYSPKNYKEPGGSRTVIGGSLDIVSGGDLDIESGGSFKIAGTAVTATAAEINAIAGGGLSSAELGVLDGVTPGTATASKAVVLDGSKGIATITSATITTLTSTTVDSGTVTNSDLVLESQNPLTVKLNDTNSLQFDNSAISGFAAAADTAGTDVYVETQDGGVDTAVDGGSAGGALSVKAGDGSAGGADQNGAAGGSLTITAGAGSAGGAHTANNPNGGDGGDITLAVGAGGAAGGGTGVAGDPGKVQVSGGLFHFNTAQVIDMSDAAVTLTLNPGTPAGTTMTSNFLRVDANSGEAGENLLLPPEADCAGVVAIIQNTGGENVVVQNDAGGAVDTVATAEFGMFFCDGTDWFGMNKA